jgi:hypothetical protein
MTVGHGPQFLPNSVGMQAILLDANCIKSQLFIEVTQHNPTPLNNHTVQIIRDEKELRSAIEWLMGCSTWFNHNRGLLRGLGLALAS